MIEVVGKDESIKKRATCYMCCNILSYSPIDVKTEVYRDYNGDVDSVKVIKCPCGPEVKV